MLQGVGTRTSAMGTRELSALLFATLCFTVTQGGDLGEDSHSRQLNFMPSGLKGPGRVESDTQREGWRVNWQERSEADYREIERKATFHKLEDDQYTAAGVQTPMRPLVPKIESQQCLMNLVRENSPIGRSMSRKYIPKAYNLMSREYSYKGPGIPEAFKTPCFQKCALVGSSGVLQGTKWGPVIDGYDAVIRLNNAPTYGHEEDVGSRTTVRIMHDFHIKEHNLAEMLRIDPGGFILVWPPEDKPKGLGGPSPKPEKTKYLAYWLEYSNATILLTRYSRAGFYDSHMMARTHVGPFPPHVPSTGWNAFYSVLHFCQEIHAYGLAWQLSEESYRRAGHTKTGKAYYWYKHDKGNVNEDDYYYNDAELDFSYHSFEREKEFFVRAGALMKIFFH
mmetsp:Transcript_25749/g.72051  ORF Transcript_25749/g.72051 Transcript_25749/m.72051 type:complete len:393 (+) Transcript_25749:127-1305(+)